MLRDRPGYQQQGFVPPSPSTSPTSSTASKCRSIRRGIKQKNGQKLWLCCCCYCSSTSTSFLTSIGVFILVLAYTVLGAFIFMALENGFNPKSLALPEKSEQLTNSEDHDKKQKIISNEEIRLQTVEKLWSITEDLNILYKENWTRLATQEVLKFQESLVKSLKSYGGGVTVKTAGVTQGAAVYYTHHQHQWSFAASFLYSLTLITTIGYGSIAPKTSWGKLTTIIYAVVGIPLMLIYLSTTGEILSRYFRTLYAKVFCVKTKKKTEKKSKAKKCKTEATYLNTTYGHKHNSIVDGKIPFTTSNTEDMIKDRSGVYDCGVEPCGVKHTCQHHPTVKVPIFLCLFFILLYICGGAYLFHYLENWTYLESSFFCFASLSTIGFGDLMPGLHHNMNLSKKSSVTGEIISVVISSSYILMGMAMIAMCFNLVQEQAVFALKKMTKFFGVINDNLEEKDEIEGPPVEKKNPVPILKQPKILQTHTLPRRREDDKNRIRFNEFQRGTTTRCSGSSLVKPSGNNEAMEYFVPRSVSEFNLAGIVTDVVLIPPPPQTVIRPSSAASVLRTGRLGDPILIGNGKAREKMVTFEDDAVAPANRKNLTALEDVFM